MQEEAVSFEILQYRQDETSVFVVGLAILVLPVAMAIFLWIRRRASQAPIRLFSVLASENPPDDSSR